MAKSRITIKNAPLSPERYAIKAPYTMTPLGVTIHETDNNAPARNEIAYMQRNNNKISFHLAVDEAEIIQGVPLNRNTWNAGDGVNGTGNRRTIAIEICRNYRTNDLTKYYKARALAEELVGWLLYVNNWSAKDIYFHNTWSGKNCPRQMRLDGYTNTFKQKAVAIRDSYAKPTVKPPITPPVVSKSDRDIAKEILYTKHTYGDGAERRKKLGARYEGVMEHINNILYGTPLPSTPSKPKPTPTNKYKVRDYVTFNKLATQSAGGKVVNAGVKGGTITKVYDGTPYPYRIGTNIGFVSDKLITGTNTPVNTKPPQKTREYVVLDKSVTRWGVYKLNTTPISRNIFAYLAPKKAGGLTYEILGRPYADTVTIRTRDFGKVNIWIGAGTSHKIIKK